MDLPVFITDFREDMLHIPTYYYGYMQRCFYNDIVQQQHLTDKIFPNSVWLYSKNIVIL